MYITLMRSKTARITFLRLKVVEKFYVKFPILRRQIVFDQRRSFEKGMLLIFHPYIFSNWKIKMALDILHVFFLCNEKKGKRSRRKKKSYKRTCWFLFSSLFLGNVFRQTFSLLSPRNVKSFFPFNLLASKRFYGEIRGDSFFYIMLFLTFPVSVKKKS